VISTEGEFIPPPVGGWNAEALIYMHGDPVYRITALYETMEQSEEVATRLNQYDVIWPDYDTAIQSLRQAKAIITKLLLVLHEHSGSKRHISTEARTFLGLKSGAKVGSLEDKIAVMYPTEIS